MASTVIYRDSVSQGHNKFTFSAWIKKSNTGGTQSLLGMYNTNNLRGKIRFNYSSDSKLYVWIKNAVGTEFNWYSNGEYRDCNGCYHIVVAMDTTQATASNRCKVYVNGEYLTGNTSGQDIVQNSTTMIFGHSKHSVGNSYYNGSWEAQYFDGIMSHVHCCYGYAYQASDFGSTDSTTGEWKINTSPNVQYGTNGFFILKDGNSTTDQSGNSISLTTNGTLSKTEDCPSNIFATMNPLSLNDANGNFTHGNTSNNTGASAWRTMFSTMGDRQGKYYCEMKYVSGSNQMFGIFSLDEKNKQKNVGYVGDNNLGNRAVGLAKGGDYYINGSTSTYPGGSNTSWTTGDIIMIAMDRTNKKVYFGKNGTWMGSGDPTSGSTGTGAISFQTEDHESWGFATSCYASTSATNFGNGYFQTTAVSNAGTNASGNGIFEYDVPTGYTALSTKGLNL